MAKKTYVLDTSACLSDPNCIYSFANNDIVIPLKVLEEIDNHKKRQDGVGTNARSTIRILDELRSKGNLQQGIRIHKGKGVLKVRGSDPTRIPPDLDPNVADHNIISTAIAEDQENGNRKTILVSRDINMRVICDSLGLNSEDYTENQIIKKDSDLYMGFIEILVDDQVVDKFYADEPIVPDSEEYKGLYANQFVMLVSNSNDKKTALCKFIDYKTPLLKVNEFKQGLWGVRAKNKEQSFALDLLMDPAVPVVSLVGKAGSGKTLLAIAAGLEQVMPNYNTEKLVAKMNHSSSKRKPFADGQYKKLVVSRPVMPMGKDIGFLPGTMEDKMAPWLAPIQDNLKFLTGDDIVIDEAQNLTAHEIKTILTRVGEGTKIVLTGDIEQIDNIYINETSSGLVHAVEKFKGLDLSGHVTLRKGERSKVATMAAKYL